VAVRFESLIKPPIGFAHRGGRAHAPENTIEAFERAVELGATGIETDARLTADGEVVLIHDANLRRPRWLPDRRVFGRPVADLRRDQIPDEVPTLGDYYARCGASLPLSIDVKDAAAFTAVVEAARDYGAAGRLWACHDDLAVLARWRAEAPEVRLVHSARGSGPSGGPERHAAELARLGIDAVNLRHDHWSGGRVTLYHKFGVLAFGWDAQQHHQIEELIDAGIDAFYSDHVDRIARALSSLRA